jgi:hypothetical protein
MDERCEVLMTFGGKMYAGIEEYDGETFLKAWENGYEGTGKGLKKEYFINPRSYRGHPDDALGRFSRDGACQLCGEIHPSDDPSVPVDG